MTILLICLIIATLICLGVLIYESKKLIQLKSDEEEETRRIERLNASIQLINGELEQKSLLLQDLSHEAINSLAQKEKIEQQIQSAQDNLNNLQKMQESQKKSIQDFEELTSSAKEKYFEELEKDYQKREKEYDVKYAELENTLMSLEDSIRAKVKARKREEQIEENKDNYRLNLSSADLRDIKILESIKEELTNPAAVNKIIWSNYYQPLAKVKFPKIIGKSTGCGIYKITNTITGESYIGQSNDLYKRWNDHCKDGLGAGSKAATAQSKLYGNIRKYSLNNFTFEVLEFCTPAELDKKEKEYITLYDTYNNGMNATRGNN